MATAILASAADVRHSALYEHFYAEIMSLALELCEHEGLTLANAINQAAQDLEGYEAIAGAWDRQAFYAGNDVAMPF